MIGATLGHYRIEAKLGDGAGQRNILEAAAVSPALARIARVVESLPVESGERGEAR